LKRLALIRCDAALEPAGDVAHVHGIAGDANLRDALAAMLAAGVDSLAVRDAAGAVQGIVTLAGVRARTVTELTS
jgi:CBS domain-containing protein